MGNDASSGEPTTVLVVDDDPEILNMLEVRLSNTGYRVITARDGEAAIKQAEDEQPRVVVLDVMMPKKTGWEVARALRQNEATKDVKILMLTAIGPQMNEMTAPLYGADAHIDKPFDFKKLEKAIAELLG